MMTKQKDSAEKAIRDIRRGEDGSGVPAPEVVMPRKNKGDMGNGQMAA